MSDLLDKITDGIIITNLKGRIIYFNEPVTRILQTQREELQNANLFELFPLFEEFNENEEATQLEFTSFDGELVFLCRKEEINKQKVFFLSDITYLKRFQDLKERNLSKVINQLRSPLTSVKGALELLVSCNTMNEKERKMRQELVDLAIKGNTKALEIVNNLSKELKLEKEAD